MFRLVASVALLGGCAQLQLDPQFAPRAEELPMAVPGGFMPPEHFSLGGYRVSGVEVKKDSSFTLGLGAFEAKFGGNWHLRGDIDFGGKKGGFECVGPGGDWRQADKVVHVSVGEASLGCNVDDGSRQWAMLFGVALAPNADLPEWLRGLAALNAGPRDPRDWDALLRSSDGRTMLVRWAHQTVRVGNVGGYYVEIDGGKVGAVDVTFLGAPRAYIARDAPADARPSIAAAMAVTYVLVGL